ELHHGKIAEQEIFALSDEEQIDEVLEELWVLAENGEPAELGRVEVEGALPMRLALERMEEVGLVELEAHTHAPHTHKPVLNRCHVAFRPSTDPAGHGEQMIVFTEKGRKRAEDIIRRHRLAERLFMRTFQVVDEQEVAEQACRFEHILSPEATDSICSFLGHPRTCPHGSPIPAGQCCITAKSASHGQEAVRSEEHTSELQSPCNLVCRLLLEKKNKHKIHRPTRQRLLRHLLLRNPPRVHQAQFRLPAQPLHQFHPLPRCPRHPPMMTPTITSR